MLLMERVWVVLTDTKVHTVTMSAALARTVLSVEIYVVTVVTVIGVIT